MYGRVSSILAHRVGKTCLSPGFHHQSQKDFGVHLCKLGKLKADIVSCIFPFLYSFRPPQPNFLGALSMPWRTPTLTL
ncbi:hypothetical protein BT96DRAFT_78721 [Gymnopus androsaceus JB14]|uniref:Uncharacterized protein n=1 Tax=Gymnopus androsaceus JB14 TaxID=1447944 RepID=A0A6A4HFE5_9AGAR|nr:hypothetical protein BT96DRAFT_78721 [Gymnopus androsaceus JB14]